MTFLAETFRLLQIWPAGRGIGRLVVHFKQFIIVRNFMREHESIIIVIATSFRISSRPLPSIVKPFVVYFVNLTPFFCLESLLDNKYSQPFLSILRSLRNIAPSDRTLNLQISHRKNRHNPKHHEPLAVRS